MCCVMPPASRSATRVVADRIEQRRLAVVDVAHDRDDRRARDRVFRPHVFRLHLEHLLFEVRSCTSAPNSRAIIDAVSVSTVLLIVIIMPLSSSFLGRP